MEIDDQSKRFQQASPERRWAFVQPLTRGLTNGPKDTCKMTIDKISMSMLIILSPKTS